MLHGTPPCRRRLTTSRVIYLHLLLLQATEFHDAWFQSSRKELEAAGLLTEFFKHTDLCAACAISATAALEKKSGKMASTEEKLRDYIDQSGAWEENGIKSVRSLLDIMLITGVIHGGTLSMTRLFSVVKVLPWHSPARLMRLLKERPAAQGS